MALLRIAKKTLSDEVFDQLSREIVQGRMAPGVQLPAERELSDVLGVNRGAVREALKRLAQAGLVAIAQGGATKVLDFRRSAGMDLLASLLMHEDGTVDLDVARSVMEMRGALAPEVARLCAKRGGADEVRALKHIVSRMNERAGDDAQLQDLALDFWDVLVRGADNIAYALAFNTLRTTYDKIRGALVHVMAGENRDLARFRAIAEAVARKDESAARRQAAALLEQGTAGVLDLIEALRRAGQEKSP
jgi:DNA-binding FadR family transcriptional regulator